MCYTESNQNKEEQPVKIVILDSATLGNDIDPSPIYKCGKVSEYPSTLPNEVAERIGEAEVIVVNKIKLNASNLEGAKALRLICVTATGYDNIDTEYCAARGIALYNVPKYSTDSVSQVTVAMALSLVNRLKEYRDYVSSGQYSASGVANKLTPVYHELSSMTWGIVGGGAIGSRVAAVASALGCHVIVCRRSPDPIYETCDIDTLCQRADIISLHVPLTDETRGMISRARIEKMKKDAILINVARGAVTDEEALADAIEDGRLGGIGIDVFSEEPFGTSHPFSRIAHRHNVCLTPHMAWGSFEARTRCVEIIAKNIDAFFTGDSTNRII